ncbi:iron chaperone [Galbibacter sp.]|uniref:iron chaperone n=1 Tax=Galbibacter sp. TaxID=2918471 RepID=UPI003A8D4AFD
MTYSKPNTIEEFIMDAPEESREIMISLSDLIESTEPKAEGGISWNVPIYKYHGVLAGFSLAKKHVSFGIDSLTAEIRETLEKKGYKTGKKTIQIKFNQVIPKIEIEQLIGLQARLNESKK